MPQRTISKNTKKGGSLVHSQEHLIQVFENVQDSETKKRQEEPYLYFHEKRMTEDENVRQLLSLLFPDRTNMTANVTEVLDELEHEHYNNPSQIIKKKVKIPTKTKLIVIGDVHGEIDPLKNTIVHWYDQGYIRKTGHLNKNIMVISTGDLVDYNMNSFDILYAMLKLRKLNPNHVILLRGNHEGEWWVSGKQTLYDELHKKGILEILHAISNQRKRQFIPHSAKWKFEQNMTALYLPAFRATNPTATEDQLQHYVHNWVINMDYIHEFLYFTALLRNIGHTMLLLQYKNDRERFAFMHGMWPVVNYGHDNTIDLEYWKEDDEEISTPLSHIDPCRPNFHIAIMWNDLSDGQDSKISRRGIPYCVEVGSMDLFLIMQQNNVKAIVRGHQDLCHTQQGMMTYDHQGMYTCANGAAVHISKECKSGEAPQEGWCESPIISVHSTPMDDADAARRVFTSSMAHWKSRGYACMGAYTVISSASASASASKSSEYSPIISPPVTSSSSASGGKAKSDKPTKGGTVIKIPQNKKAPVQQGEQTMWGDESCKRRVKQVATNKNVKRTGI